VNKLYANKNYTEMREGLVKYDKEFLLPLEKYGELGSGENIRLIYLL
jgi:hypothetical protein